MNVNKRGARDRGQAHYRHLHSLEDQRGLREWEAATMLVYGLVLLAMALLAIQPEVPAWVTHNALEAAEPGRFGYFMEPEGSTRPSPAVWGASMLLMLGYVWYARLVLREYWAAHVRRRAMDRALRSK